MIEKIILTPSLFFKLQRIKGDIFVKEGEMECFAYVSDEPVPKSEWASLPYVPFEKGKKWTDKKYACCVFRLKGKVPAECKDKKIIGVLKLGSEGEVYQNGMPVCGVTPILSTIDAGQPLMGKQIVPLFEKAQGGECVDLTVDCGNNGYCGVFLYDPRFIKADICSENKDIKDYYYDFLFLLLTVCTKEKNDFLTDEDVVFIKKKLNESYAEYKAHGALEAREVLLPLIEKKQTEGVEYTAIGHGHLDLAWRWPMREGKRKAVRTFSNVVNYLNDYDFVFGASQAQMFEWTEENEPELFEKIKTAVSEGKIEIQGGMWTECDCNVPCGESLIRQFLYGGRYFEEKFGKNSDVAWLPDAFGFPETLPQIIKGVGKKYFMTIKLNWNETNEFPYQTFNWVGPDGSKVFSHFAPEGGYHSSATPLSFVKADYKNKQKDVGGALLIYGVSDGGGGPGEGHLEMLKRSGNVYLPRSVAASSESFFNKVSERPVPEYSGELYLEKHRGTLTSQAKNKYYNRYAERKMHDLEWLEAVSGIRYENRDKLWKTVLKNQFHDVLPGSSIGRVHRESVEELRAVCEEADEAIADILKKISSGKRLTALNPSPFDVKEKILIGQELYYADCKAYSSCEPVKADKSEFSCGEDFMENELLKVTFDVRTGKIVSVIDKETGKEEVKENFALAVYEDPKGRYDAWDIDASYLNKKRSYPKLKSMSISEGKDRVSANVSFIYGNSTVTQEIYLKDSKQIVFDTQVNWNESHKMLRTDFVPSVYSDEAYFDVQFGVTKRSTKNGNEVDKARFEVCGHYYASVGDDENGYVGVISDSKYGYRVKEGEISLNLLRSPKKPDAECDMGDHVFSYAVSFCKSEKELLKAAYEFNDPLIITEEKTDIAPLISFAGDVVIETVKPAENGDGTIIRAYERFGDPVDCEFVANGEVYETDMLERNPSKTERAVFTPHQIKTFLIK